LKAVKKIAVVPTLLTLGNGICGFIAIAVASKIYPGESPTACDIYFAVAGWFIMAAMVFDMFDGYVARLSKTASKFGGELDSLCDAISFGVAPAFLLLKMGPGWEPRPLLHQLLAGIAALYVVCAVLRLARFNVDNTPDPASHKRFRGLPSPAAAGCLASLAVLRGGFPERLAQVVAEIDFEGTRQLIARLVEVFSPLGALIIALLMVSNVPYPHVTKQIFRGRRNLAHLIQVLLGVLIIVLMRELSLLLIFWIYALAMPLRHMLARHFRRDQLPTPDALPR
jgi:CDP-diacylglycerol--serine O-phosphatidyltransferase